MAGILLSTEYGQRLDEHMRAVQNDLPANLSIPRPQPQLAQILGGGGEWKFGKLDSNLTGGAGNNVEMSIWQLNEAEDDWEDTGDNVTVYAPPLLPNFDILNSATWVIVHKHSDGKWYVTNSGCTG